MAHVFCDEVRQVMPWLVDDEFNAELDGEQCRDIKQHLKQCGACSEALSRQVQQRAALRHAAASVTAPPRLRDRVRDTIERERLAPLGNLPSSQRK